MRRAGPGLLAGNRIELLQSGVEYFPALLQAIRGAQREILLETYIFERDATGVAVAEALREAALRGVVVRVLVDGFGAREFVREGLPELQSDGVETLVFRPEIRQLSLRRHRLRRLHRKLVVIDGRTAFVGGINIIDDMDTPGQIPPRFDFAVRVQGPLVAEVHAAMARLWRLVLWAGLRRRLMRLRWVRPGHGRVGSMHAAFVIRDNLRHRRDIENAYLDAIREARHEVLLANAYFFPGRAFRHALTDAAARGVKVTLLLQGRVEYWLLHHACRVLYPHLMAAGVRIVEYRKSFLHAKVAVVDADWATVGSSNIDPFSLLLAREANVVVRDRSFAADLRRALHAAILDGGCELTPVDWQRRSLLQRGLSWLAYGVLRLMLGVAGYGRRAL